MRNLIRLLAVVALCLSTAVMIASAASASRPSTTSAAQASGGIVGQCWKDGVLLYEEDLGDSSDPNFPARAQEFYERCLRHGGTAKFVERQYTRPPALSIGDVQVREPVRLRRALFRVTLSEPSSGAVRVNYETVGGSATPGRDYRGAGGTLVFRPGETSKTIGVWILGDRRREPRETFLVRLLAVEGAELGDPVGQATIRGADPCVCDEFDVKLGYLGHYSTSNGPPSGWKMFALSVRYRMKCTQGDPSNCKGRYQLLGSEGPPNSGTHIPPEDKHDFVCLSPNCDTRTGQNGFRLRIKTEALAGQTVTIRIKVRYGCLTGNDTRQRVKTLSLVLANGEFDRDSSDLDGDGRPDRLR